MTSVVWQQLQDHFTLVTTVDTQGRRLFSAAPSTALLDTRMLLAFFRDFLYMFKKLIGAQRDPVINNPEGVNSALSCVAAGAPALTVQHQTWF